MDAPIFSRPDARHWRAPAHGESPLEFHRTIPGYEPTPLIELPTLAGPLGVGQVFVKDESNRMGLPAFKILGASYAIARVLSARVGSEETLSLDELRSRVSPGSIRLVAATEGNHGRAVAHVAALLGLASTILVPSGVSEQARAAISGEGAELEVVEGSYDDAVAHASSLQGPDTLLIQDTALPGYTDVPSWVVAGYTTMLREVDIQLSAHGVRTDIIVVPVGVGSLAQAVVGHYRSGDHSPSIVAVEPRSAASLSAALEAGSVVSIPTAGTVMTGLNCGTVSQAAFQVLGKGLDRSIAISDEDALDSVERLSNLNVDAGPCGAATLAGYRGLVSAGEAVADGESVLVLLSTEGRSANPKMG